MERRRGGVDVDGLDVDGRIGREVKAGIEKELFRSTD